jgi:hypothetical protein
MAAQVTTNILSHFGIVRVILDARVICRNSRVDVWDVPEVLAQEEHLFGHILAEFHHLFTNVSKKSIA